MNRRQKRTLLLALGLVVLLTALLLGVRSCKAQQAEREQELQEQKRQENLVPTKSNEFQSIAYDNSTTNLSFTRDEEGSWIWADDPSFPLDGSYLEQLSGLITNLDPMQTITEGDTLEAYGLDNPSGTITATAADGAATTLILGKALSDGSYYLKTDDSDTVYVVASDLHDHISMGVYEMALLEEFPVLTADRLKTVAIAGAQTVNLRVSQSAEDKTVWTSGGTDVTEQVSDLASALPVLAFSACKDYNPSEEAVTVCGFDTPAAVLTVDYADDEGGDAQMVLTIANETTDGSGRYARLNDSTTIYSISGDMVSAILSLAQNGLSA